MQLVIVESPAKAKTIEKYLGRDYRVMASYGHVRDLPSKDGSVRPDENFAMTYEVDPKAAKRLAEIARALKSAERLYLATDPDREGEAISWHVVEALAARKAIKDIDVKRVVFNEITKSAVTEAMRHPRDLDMDLVNAQQARRALDYLVGFTLSPVLWRKLPGARSAGRVQSVALRLICDREVEIEAFRPREYWTVEADFRTADGGIVPARLVRLDGRKLDKFDLATEEAARAAADRIAAGVFRVAEVTTKPVKRNPQPPFTTSTLQQEASRKLGFGAKRTMDVAQKLYEGIDVGGGDAVGLITYMRTDGVQMAAEAVTACRRTIADRFGADFVPSEPRAYRSKAKNAQEAHEAIRPTDFGRLPAEVAPYLSEDQRRLYDLIWKRALASQMASARLERTTAEITNETGDLGLRATGTVVRFPGFLKLYEEGRDDQADNGRDDGRLPEIAAGARLGLVEVRPGQHFTEPPPRFTEATLVKRLEELGIGRPSTYAQILTVLREREYVRLEKGRFVPEDKGRLVTAFLASFFRRYVEYDFTADMEAQLDEISAGRVEWTEVLRDFWEAFRLAVDDIAELRVKDVLEALDDLLGPHIFPESGDSDPRACPSCDGGRLGLKLGRFGAFVGCSNYPDCRYTRPLGSGRDEPEVAEAGPRTLGHDPETGLVVTLRKGPYGHYVQLGEAESGEKPKRVSLPRDVAPDSVDLTLALRLLSLPREVGAHPETGKPIVAGLGRYGPYLRHDGVYARLGSSDEALTVGLNRAVALLAEQKGKGRRGASLKRVLGQHPEDGEPVNLMDGRYGPYVSHGRVRASLPKGTDPDGFGLDEAVALLAAKGKGKSKGRRKAPAKATSRAKAKTPRTAKSRGQAGVGSAADSVT